MIKVVVGDPDVEGTCETLSYIQMQTLVNGRWWLQIYSVVGSDQVPEEPLSDGRQ